MSHDNRRTPRYGACASTLVLALLALLSLLLSLLLPSPTPALADVYTTSPRSTYTFDAQPTVPSSAGSIAYYSSVLGRAGVVGFTGNEWLNLAQIADARGATFPTTLSQPLTLEAWVYWTELSSGARLLELADTDSGNDALTVQVNDLQSVTQAGFLFTSVLGSDASTLTSLKANGSAASVTAGAWLHMVFTITQNGATPTVSRTAATYTAYVNGNQLNSTNGYLPNAVTRSSVLVGRGRSSTAPYGRFLVDALRYYNYPLSQEQVWAHAAVLTVPILDLSFGTDPRIYLPTGVNATYSWQNVDQTVPNNQRRYRQGLLTFATTADLWVDLTQPTGASSIYTTFTSAFGGAPDASTGVTGWSFETMVRFSSLAAGSKVFEFATSTTADNIYVGVSSTTANLVEFGVRGADGSLTTVAVVTGARINTWYHVVVIAGAADSSPSSQALYTVYINGVANATATGAWPRSVARTTALIGRGADATLPTFSGLVSLLRIYPVALTATDAFALYLTLNPNANGTTGNGGNGNAGNQTTNRWGLIYSTGATATYSFDSAPTATDLAYSSFSWDAGSGDHTKSLVNLRWFPDNSGLYLPDLLLGGSTSFEMWIKFTDFALYSRVFDFGGPLGSDDEIAFGNEALTPVPQLVVGYGSATSIVALGSLSLRNWTHVVVSINQFNAFAVNTAQSAQTTIFIDGVQVSQSFTYLPSVTQRPNCFLGVSNVGGRLNFRGAIDDFYVYNYSLTYEAVLAHKQVRRAPIYEQVFSTNPRNYVGLSAQQATYNWTARTGASEEWHDGLLMLNIPTTSTTQNVVLNGVTGNSILGTSWPVIGGMNGWVDLQPSTRGWSLEFEFMVRRINSNAKLFYTSVAGVGTSADTNVVSLGFSSDSTADPNTIYFESSFNSGSSSTRSSRTIAVPNVQTDTWYNVVITVQPVDATAGTAIITTYLNGNVQAVTPATAGAWILGVNRTAAYLGRSTSTSTTSPYFSAYLDSMRIFDYALSAAEVTNIYVNTASAPPAAAAAPIYANSPLRKYSFDAAISADDATTTTPSWSASSQGRAGVLSFDGATTYVDAKSVTDDRGRYFPSTFGGSLTIELWVNFVTLADGVRLLEFAAANNSSDMLSLRVSASTTSPGTFGLTLIDRINAQTTGIDTAVGSLSTNRWTSIVVTINQTLTGGNNNQNRTTTNAACAIYVDAVKLVEATCGVPRTVSRPTTWIGRSIATSTAPSVYLQALVDQLNWYNYALSADQIKAHTVVPSVPVGDLAFPRDPRTIPGVTTTGANFGWIYADSLNDPAIMQTYHTGLLQLVATQQQYIDLSVAAGAQSIGTIVGVADLERNLVNQAASRQGSTWEVSFKMTSRTAREVLLYVGPADASSDRFTIGFTDASGTLYFSGYTAGTGTSFSTAIVGNVVLNQWYHLVLTVTLSSKSTTGSIGVYTVRVNNVVVLSGFEAGYLRETDNHHIMLGASADPSYAYPNVLVDGFRVYDYAMTLDETSTLFAAVNPTDYPYPDPSPSNTGGGSSSSSGGLSKGGVAGAVIGSVVGALVLVGVVLLVARRVSSGGSGSRSSFGPKGESSDGGAASSGGGRAPTHKHQSLEEEDDDEIEMNNVA